MFTGLFLDAFVFSPFIDRTDSEMVWSIAAGPSENDTPNILSELSYRDISSSGTGLVFAHLNTVNDNWAFYIEGNYRNNNIDSGFSQDSDYFSDNRQDEFSRSYADISGDTIAEKNFAIGMKTRWFGQEGHYVTFLLGHRDHTIDLRVTNGVQIIPDSLNGTPLTGLNTTYNAEFISKYAGIATEHVFTWGTIGLRYEYHDLTFSAEADWNLRTDFAHPVSFTHEGNGKGSAMTLAYSYPIRENWDVYFNYTLNENLIENGYDTVYFYDGSATSTRLNEVDYSARTMDLGFRYLF
ncbi:MAG: hypothetical protein KTR20_00935 [Cellvibrionaceae bacterium]|nr:hypothetical protein [Cellvibrionaceae bacterium]